MLHFISKINPFHSTLGAAAILFYNLILTYKCVYRVAGSEANRISQAAMDSEFLRISCGETVQYIKHYMYLNLIKCVLLNLFMFT
jgi:hypothetical protein